MTTRSLTNRTIQSQAAYETLVRMGVLLGRSAADWTDFHEAYGWMLGQMDRGRPGPHGGLLWLWPTAPRHLLRNEARRARGQVLLTICVPRECVLLSDFLDWHSVLNRSLHVPTLPGENADDWEARWSPLEDDFSTRARPYCAAPIDQWPEDLRTEIESSWDAIFEPETWRTPPVLQAVTRELHARDVVRAVRIR